MQPPAQSQTSPASATFAGLLATLASPSREEADPATGWDESDLGEDVATLSYERALHAHARYRPADSSDWPITQPRRTEPADAQEAATRPAGDSPQSASDRDLRTVSVTIRLSKGECARLHKRAAEAGVTVSAYMRSCTFEAEALRAQVKAALAELRSAEAKENPAAPAKERRSWFGWLARLIPNRRLAGHAP
ncbi:MAG: hypothetical protein ABR865_05445 [Terracidiphilus sp.]|jgi:hypothetical protein